MAKEGLIRVRWIYRREEWSPALKIALKPGREYEIPGHIAESLKSRGRVEFVKKKDTPREEELEPAAPDTETGEAAVSEDGVNEVIPRPTGGKPGIFSRRSKKE